MKAFSNMKVKIGNRRPRAAFKLVELLDLVAALNDKDDNLRSSSAEALWAIGVPEEHARDTVPALIALLGAKDAGPRLNAVGALSQVHAESGKIFIALKKRFGDSDRYGRAQAAESSAFPALNKAGNSKDGSLRTAATLAIAAIQGQ